MKIVIDMLALLLLLTSCYSREPSQYNTLTPAEANIMLRNGTERAGSGIYNNFYKEGIYLCKQCNLPLFRSENKFDSKTGWPSFDDMIAGAVETERDGSRTEIHCSRCKGHLGHVFYGEGFTQKSTRHCVNSLSLQFVSKERVRKAHFAGGCFWGVEYYLEQAKGVLSVTSGFMGGKVENPSYKEVIRGRSGHVETVEVLYDSTIVSYESLAKLFFEIHDPTQTNGQGPDIGSHYLSKVFVKNSDEKKVIDSLIETLERKGNRVATTVIEGGAFYLAEQYHQDYYIKKGGAPYCHKYTKRF